MKSKLIILLLLLSIGLSGCYYSYNTKHKSKSKSAVRIFYDVARGPSGYCDSFKLVGNSITIYKDEFPNDSITYINVPVAIQYITE